MARVHPAMTASHSLVVVGGGISGLVCAYALRRAGLDAVLLESSDRPGGVIRSERHDAWLFEHGPQSFTATGPLLGLIREIGLEEQIVRGDSRAPRFVLVNGALERAPLNPAAFFGSSLFGWGTKFSILRDLFGRSYPPAEDESIAQFIRRKFSAELLEKLVGPFVSGVYAGDPERLSLRSAFPQLHAAELAKGSLIRGMLTAAKKKKGPRERPTLLSFREGNEMLPQALAERLGDSLRLRTEVTRIEENDSSATRRFSLEVTRGGHGETLFCERLVVATPPDTSGRLLAGLDPAFETHLGAIEFSAVAVVSLGYEKQHIARDVSGFGFLVPRSAGLRILGTVWNSSLFPGRAPEGQVLMTSFLGGATDPGIALLSPAALADLAHRELAPLLQIQQQPVFSHVHVYPRALPQYNLGHSARLARLEKLRAAFPGLWFAGNYWNGPAVGSCSEFGLETAAAILAGSAAPAATGQHA
jgi:oxygen-dependent protoporphyrinogen oxidase